MKRISVATLFAVLLLFGVALVSSNPTDKKPNGIVWAAEETPCSLAGAAGNWSFSDTGTVLGVGLRVAAGRFTLHSDGQIDDGVATSSLNGVISTETFSGTATVNNDCTGTITATVASALGTLELEAKGAFDENMHEDRAVFTSAKLNGNSLQTVIAFEAKKQ